MNKTNAMRQLETAKINFRTAEYEVDENDLSGVHVAKELGQPPEQVFKTLVLKGERTGFFVCCIPVDKELDLKKAAKAPIGMKKKFPTFIDETAILFDEIAVSAGIRGAQIIVNGETLAEYLGAELIDLVQD